MLILETLPAWFDKRKRQNMEREKGYNYSIPEDPGNLLVLSQSFMQNLKKIKTLFIVSKQGR